MKWIAITATVFLAACGSAPPPAPPAGPPVELTSRELAKKYEANEAAAKQELDGHLLVVSGKIQSIELDISDEPTLNLDGADEFSHVLVNLTDASQKQAASLSKGQKVTVRCSEVTEVIGTPVLNNCDIS